MSFEFLLLAQNLPFTIALTVVFILAFIEGVGLAFGAGLSDMIGGIFPEMDISIEGPDLEGGNTLGAILAWLRVGQVPIIILLIVFLTSFAISGYALQIFTQNLFGFLFPAFIAGIIAVFAALPCTRVLGGLMHKYLPKDETYAVSSDSFIGRVANITLGTAAHENAAEAKLKDEHGKTHYIMVEPDNDKETFDQSDELLIVRQENGKFFVIAHSN